MLLILMFVSCLQSQPKNCSIVKLTPFEFTDEGVRAACHEFLTPIDALHKKALTVMYAKGLDVRMSNASAACMSIPENQPKTGYKETFLNLVEGK